MLTLTFLTSAYMHSDISEGDVILVGVEIPFSNAIQIAKDGVRYFNQAAEALQKGADLLLRQSRLGSS